MDYLGMAERGEHPLLLAKMPSGYAVLADTQFLAGYCLLLASPKADHLTDLAMPDRMDYLRDMSVIGEALQEVCGANGLRRINYEILGNTDTYLHAHIIPRYLDESDEYIGMPAFNYPKDRWSDQKYLYDASRHGEMRRHLTEVITSKVETYE